MIEPAPNTWLTLVEARQVLSNAHSSVAAAENALVEMLRSGTILATAHNIQGEHVDVPADEWKRLKPVWENNSLARRVKGMDSDKSMTSMKYLAPLRFAPSYTGILISAASLAGDLAVGPAKGSGKKGPTKYERNVRKAVTAIGEDVLDLPHVQRRERINKWLVEKGFPKISLSVIVRALSGWTIGQN